ncbi:aspartyl-phosphate phosphatase Spo0E family protein [Paraliobacillus sediminis]|uniref:aspartyl-phosphate phosphatase Spo0E family protein n=1 Tax=Paraliobacillus sediminis TaxID=1885916 RepID=UPI000E3E88C7|nr:aspartyl-phosphate phosphatase Spo0E family protein [Paraliobacillus sediminis]
MGDSQAQNERLEQLRLQMYMKYSKTKDEKEIVEISQELDKLIYEFISIPGKNRLA